VFDEVQGEGDFFMSNRYPLNFPPAWACGWGDDNYGLYAIAPIDILKQRFRWIESGEFMMGSPSFEKGRFDDEGPQHRVQISEGFWLADTACTQELWSLVMGANPS
jgi:formylglycine-generating enzyme